MKRLADVLNWLLVVLSSIVLLLLVLDRGPYNAIVAYWATTTMRNILVARK